MVTAHFRSDPEGWELTASGHAGTAPKGEDLVCAAVSVLLTTLAAVVGDRGEHSLAPGWGRVFCPRPEETLRAAFDFAVTGLSLLAAAYPTGVTLREERNTNG